MKSKIDKFYHLTRKKCEKDKQRMVSVVAFFVLFKHMSTYTDRKSSLNEQSKIALDRHKEVATRPIRSSGRVKYGWGVFVLG